MKSSRYIVIITITLFGFLVLIFTVCRQRAVSENTLQEAREMRYEKAIFAGGCFWCMQPPYDKLPGVIKTTVGYTGGDVKNPTYEEVSRGTTGHYEAVEIIFDPEKISYEELLEVFWKNIDPTMVHGQFADIGPQYKTAIFYYNEDQRLWAMDSKRGLDESGKFGKPIATEILPAEEFYAAEDYHQKYYQKSSQGYKLYKKGSGREDFIEKIWSE